MSMKWFPNPKILGLREPFHGKIHENICPDPMILREQRADRIGTKKILEDIYLFPWKRNFLEKYIPLL